MQEEDNDSEAYSGNGREEGDLMEQDSHIRLAEMGSNASIGQELINDLAQARSRAPLKDVHQSFYRVVVSQLQDCVRNNELPS